MIEFFKKIFNQLRITIGYWSSSNAFVHAAALAFFTVFSIAPLVIVAVTIVAIVLGDDAAQGRIMDGLQEITGPQAAEFVQSAVVASQPENSGFFPAIMGMIAILIGATTVFAQMQIALNTIWDVAPKPAKNSLVLYIRTRLLSLTLVLSIGFLLLSSLLLGIALRTIIVYAEEWLPIHPQVMIGLEFGISLLITSVLFASIFKILPDVKLRWLDVIPGAILTAVLFIGGRFLIAWYLAQTATSSTYGAAASLVIFLLWVNYSSLILLFGAAFTRAQLEIKGGTIQPSDTAVRIQKKIVEADNNSTEVVS